MLRRVLFVVIPDISADQIVSALSMSHVSSHSSDPVSVSDSHTGSFLITTCLSLRFFQTKSLIRVLMSAIIVIFKVTTSTFPSQSHQIVSGWLLEHFQAKFTKHSQKMFKYFRLCI